MDLQEIRQEINKIDDEMKKLFDERLDCSGRVAEVKIANGDQVFKPLREKEIAKRFSGEQAFWYLTYVKKVIALSRKYQYIKFIEEKQEDPRFLEIIKYKNIATVLENGGELGIELQADPNSEIALSEKEILGIVADSKLTVKDMKVDGEKHRVFVKFFVDNTEEMKTEAYVLLYMLYMETVN